MPPDATNKPSRNFAPLKPWLDIRDKQNNGPKHYLCEALKAKYQEKMEDRKEAWREIVNAGEMTAFFIEGKQVLRYNEILNSYVPQPAKNNDPMTIRAINFMQYFCTNGEAKWESSNPDVSLAPYSNADQAVSQSRKANSVVDYLENNMYPKSFKRQEGLSALIWGWYGRKVGVDFSSKVFGAVRNILGEKEIMVGAPSGQCLNAACGYRGPDKNEIQLSPQAPPMPQCPQCGSLEYNFQDALNIKIPTVVDQQKIFLPDVKCDQLYFPAWRWDMSVKLEDSSWAIGEKRISDGIWRKILGDISFPQGESGNEFGLDAIETLASAGAALSGLSDAPEKPNKGRKNEIVDTEMYLSAEDISDIMLKGDERTVDGGTLEEMRASDRWPQGIKVNAIGGMGLIYSIVDKTEENCHQETVSTGVFHMKPFSGTGRGGLTDTVEPQKQKNRFHSQIDRFFETRATPATLYAEGSLDEEARQLLGQPDVNIPVKIQNFPEFRDLNQMVRPMQGEDIPGTLFNYTMENLMNFMQITSSITSLAGGSGPIVKNADTATAARILDANGDAIWLPMLSGKGDVVVETTRKAFNLWCKHTPVARFVMFRQVSQSGQFGIEVTGKEVQGRYSWSYVPGSETPKNKMTRLEGKMNMFQQFGGILPYLEAKAQNPQEIAEIEQDFDVDFGGVSYDNLGDTCRVRFEQAKGLMTQIAQVNQGIAQAYKIPANQLPPPNPMQIMTMVEPSMEVGEPDHQGKMMWFSKLLDTDEGRQMDRQTRGLVTAFMAAHLQLAKGQALILASAESEVQQTANAPQLEQQNQQQQLQSQEAGDQRNQEVVSKQMDHQENERQRQHEKEMEEGRQKHETALARTNARATKVTA